MEKRLTPKQKRLELESFRAALAEAEQNGDMEEYVKIIWSKSVYYYLANFSKDELLANNEILERMSDGIVAAYQTLIMSRDDETAMNFINENKELLVKIAMINPEESEPVVRKMLVRKNVSAQDFVGFESQVARLSPAVQDVIKNPEEVWKICSSVQSVVYNIPKGKEWSVLDWYAETDPEMFRKLINVKSKFSPFTQEAVLERYLSMPEDQVPDSVKEYIVHLEDLKEQRIETNKKLAEIWKVKTAERKESWCDPKGQLLQFFKLDDGFPITSKEDYLFIADVFRNSGMTAYGFCKEYKISSVEGFRKMLQKVADNDPEFAEFYEEYSKRKAEQFIHASKRDIVGVATRRIDVAEVIDEHSENRDFKKLVELSKKLFDNPVVAIRFVEGVIEYYHQRVNSYGEYSTEKEDLEKRLTLKEIKFLIGADAVRRFKCGQTIDYGQEINEAIRPVMSQLGRASRVMLYDGKTGLRVRLKPYSNRFERENYLKETVEFLTSDGRGISVRPYMIDNAECFVDDNDLFKSASVMTRIVKAVAEGKIQNQQQTEEYKDRLKNKILLDMKEVSTLEEYFGFGPEIKPEKPVQVAGLLN